VFTAFLLVITVSMMLFFILHWVYFTVAENRTWQRFLCGLPLMAHALLMAVYVHRTAPHRTMPALRQHRDIFATTP
jgi:chromate transport protein ChrA